MLASAPMLGGGGRTLDRAQRAWACGVSEFATERLRFQPNAVGCGGRVDWCSELAARRRPCRGSADVRPPGDPLKSAPLPQSERDASGRR